MGDDTRPGLCREWWTLKKPADEGGAGIPQRATTGARALSANVGTLAANAIRHGRFEATAEADAHSPQTSRTSAGELAVPAPVRAGCTPSPEPAGGSGNSTSMDQKGGGRGSAATASTLPPCRCAPPFGGMRPTTGQVANPDDEQSRADVPTPTRRKPEQIVNDDSARRARHHLPLSIAHEIHREAHTDTEHDAAHLATIDLAHQMAHRCRQLINRHEAVALNHRSAALRSSPHGPPRRSPEKRAHPY